MGSSGSIQIYLVIFLGTAALIGFVKLIGMYALATHPAGPVSPASAPTTFPSATPGTDPRLLVAVLSAAAATELGMERVKIAEIHEISAQAASPEWGHHGRKMIFQSHRLRS